MRRRDAVGATAAALAWPAAASTASPAPTWPNQPLRLWVAYPPGGLSDEIARRIAQGLRERLDVPVLVEHRPGAGGALAMEAVSRAAPDGQTLCFSAISPLVPAADGRTASDPPPDPQPVIAVMHTPVLLLASADFAPSSWPAVLAAARAAPGSVRWATSGLGTVGHRVLEQVARAAGVEFTHVPYKGGGQQLNDALSGQFELLSSNVAAQQIEYVRLGRLKALAVGAPRRVAALPDVPTLAELGYPQANLVSTFGIFAPRGVAPERLARLNTALNAVLAERTLRERFAATSNLPGGGTPEEFAALIEREREKAQRGAGAGR